MQGTRRPRGRRRSGVRAGLAALSLGALLVPILPGGFAHSVPARDSAVGGTRVEASACEREPRTAVAQVCADTAANQYGMFVSYAIPLLEFGAPPSGATTAAHETEVFTDGAMTKSFAFGIQATYFGDRTEFQPYWADYTNGKPFQPVGPPTTTPDRRLRTFLAIPSCAGCRTWDVFYDYVLAGTTGEQPDVAVHHVMSGWSLDGMYGPVTLGPSSTRLRYLDGNYVFARYDRAETRVRAPDGDCGAGADPEYCWHFDTRITDTGGTPAYVTAFEVTKPIVRPPAPRAASPGPRAPRALPPGADADAGAGGVGAERATEQLIVRAQRLVDARLHPDRT